MANATKVSEKYIDLISQNAKEADKEAKIFANEEASLSVQASILETKKAISAAKRELNSTKRAEPYSLENEVTATQKVINLEAGLKVAQAIAKARF